MRAEDPREVFWLHAEPVYDRVDDLTRARLNAALDAAIAAEGEVIARAIEVADGKRCPECGGKPASTKWKGLTRLGMCGGGHQWEVRSSQWRNPEEIVRTRSAAHRD